MDQFKEEFLAVCGLYSYYFDIFGIKKYQMRLSLHDPAGLGKKYVDDAEIWLKTEQAAREALDEGGIDYVEIPGQAAFYGPKIDVQVWSAIGKEFTLATNQVDFAIPGRFGLSYTTENGEEATPICIHRAPLSTHERFIGFLIEHFGGDFPLWLAPIQVAVLPVSEKSLEYAGKIKKVLFESGIRIHLDDRPDKIGAKIRQAELAKINVMLIVGEREAQDQMVSVRRRFVGDLGKLSIEELTESLLSEIRQRRDSHSKDK
jgi:threonyl-tRNA synthetase